MKVQELPKTYPNNAKGTWKLVLAPNYSIINQIIHEQLELLEWAKKMQEQAEREPNLRVPLRYYLKHLLRI